MNIQLGQQIRTRLRDVIDTILNSLGLLNSVFILTIFFFLLVVPLGILFRLFGKSILKTHDAETLWTGRDEAVQLNKPF